LDNKYFSGVGVDGKNKRLTEKGCLAVLDNISEEISGNKAINLGVVNDEHCSPMKYAEQWMVRMENLFGTELCKLPVWQRCVLFLRSNRARTQIKACQKHKKSLESDCLPGPELN
jgi:hypothetical protein